MKEEMARKALQHDETVAFRFFGKILFGRIKNIDDRMRATVIGFAPDGAELSIPIAGLIGSDRTAEMMDSPNHKDRLIAEYIQLTIRLNRLARKIDYERNESEKVLNNNLDLMNNQFSAMLEYQHILEKRIAEETINF